jgi:hypothetical protein
LWPFHIGYGLADSVCVCIGKDGKLEIWNSQEQVAIARDMRNAQLLVGAPAETTYTPEIYYLEVDGKRLDGVYLGAENKTTVSSNPLMLIGPLSADLSFQWGFVYHDAQCGADGPSQKDFQEVKLLDLPVDEANPPTAGYDPEFKGFLKVVWF